MSSNSPQIGLQEALNQLDNLRSLAEDCLSLAFRKYWQLPLHTAQACTQVIEAARVPVVSSTVCTPNNVFSVMLALARQVIAKCSTQLQAVLRLCPAGWTVCTILPLASVEPPGFSRSFADDYKHNNDEYMALALL
jgi:hypothetical protein